MKGIILIGEFLICARARLYDCFSQGNFFSFLCILSKKIYHSIALFSGAFINNYYFPVFIPIGIVGNILSFMVSGINSIDFTLRQKHYLISALLLLSAFRCSLIKTLLLIKYNIAQRTALKIFKINLTFVVVYSSVVFELLRIFQ